MKVNVTGVHTEVTPALKDYVMEKIDKVEKHFPHITNVHVTLTVESKTHHKAEVHAHVTKGELHACSDEDDMYAAIDSMMHKLDRQVIKHKEILEQRSHGNNDH